MRTNGWILSRFTLFFISFSPFLVFYVSRLLLLSQKKRQTWCYKTPAMCNNQQAPAVCEVLEGPDSLWDLMQGILQEVDFNVRNIIYNIQSFMYYLLNNLRFRDNWFMTWYKSFYGRSIDLEFDLCCPYYSNEKLNFQHNVCRHVHCYASSLSELLREGTCLEYKNI